MIIHLSKDLERIIHNAVRTGLYAREDDVIRDALTRLKESLPKNTKPPSKKARNAKTVPQKPKKPLSPDELNKRLLASGLVDSASGSCRRHRR